MLIFAQVAADTNRFFKEKRIHYADDKTIEIGSLFNEQTDRFIENQRPKLQPQWSSSSPKSICLWWSKKKEETSVPLKVLYTVDESHLCCATVNTNVLKMQFDDRTCFLNYSYRHRERKLPSYNQMAFEYFDRGIFNYLKVDATHIVHGITWGFEVRFVVQLSNDNLTNETHCLLEKICAIFEGQQMTDQLTNADHSLWANLNVYPIVQPTSLSFNKMDIISIIARIREFERVPDDYHYPLLYTLQPVEWIYAVIVKYVPVEPVPIEPVPIEPVPVEPVPVEPVPIEPVPAEPVPVEPIIVKHSIDINVLLLGETGVGKSTFINAFINYLTFNTLEDAERSQPLAIIPVSFLTTINDQFDEVVVEFGNVDPNEDYDHPGQSVTQQCRSYIFTINDRFRLRLIDTPGMGDTRGLDQDDININHILSYISNFSHLNAICMLLKPNSSRLNVFFRSCITQLVTFLTSAANQNIVFCFTNSRTTFFAPGNTGPLLKQMLNEQHLSNIPFGKSNTFCFDSESFRYLIAKNSSVPFDDFQTQACLKSWTRSVIESERLFQYIYKLKSYQMDEWRSQKRAQLEINMMVRPIMETLRKMLFNYILEEKHENVSIELNPKMISQLSGICHHVDCKPETIKCGSIWIIEYPVHEIAKESKDTCNSCKCIWSKHIPVEYELKHKVVNANRVAKLSNQSQLNSLLELCIKFSRFMGTSDQFLGWFQRFLTEEDVIDSLKLKTNPRVRSELLKMKKHFEPQMKTTQEKQELSNIGDSINWAKSLYDIQIQIEEIGKHYENVIEIPPYNTGLLSRLVDNAPISKL